VKVFQLLKTLAIGPVGRGVEQFTVFAAIVHLFAVRARLRGQLTALIASFGLFIVHEFFLVRRRASENTLLVCELIGAVFF
jgi:hypothetical protein